MTLALAVGGLACLALGLGPSLKLLDKASVPVGAQGPVTGTDNLMPASEATASLPWSWVYGIQPFEGMRAAYRWHVGLRLVLAIFAAVAVVWLFRRRRVLGVALVALLVLETMSHGLLDAREQATQNHELVQAFDDDMDRAFGNGRLRASERVLFLPASNDYLIGMIAPRYKVFAYNIAFDKEIVRLRSGQPKPVLDVISAYGADTLNRDQVCHLFRQDLVDALVFDDFNMRWDTAAVATPAAPDRGAQGQEHRLGPVRRSAFRRGRRAPVCDPATCAGIARGLLRRIVILQIAVPSRSLGPRRAAIHLARGIGRRRLERPARRTSRTRWEVERTPVQLEPVASVAARPASGLLGDAARCGPARSPSPQSAGSNGAAPSAAAPCRRPQPPCSGPPARERLRRSSRRRSALPLGRRPTERPWSQSGPACFEVTTGTCWCLPAASPRPRASTSSFEWLAACRTPPSFFSAKCRFGQHRCPAARPGQRHPSSKTLTTRRFRSSWRRPTPYSCPARAPSARPAARS